MFYFLFIFFIFEGDFPLTGGSRSTKPWEASVLFVVVYFFESLFFFFSSFFFFLFLDYQVSFFCDLTPGTVL